MLSSFRIYIYDILSKITEESSGEKQDHKQRLDF